MVFIKKRTGHSRTGSYHSLSISGNSQPSTPTVGHDSRNSGLSTNSYAPQRRSNPLDPTAGSGPSDTTSSGANTAASTYEPSQDKPMNTSSNEGLNHKREKDIPLQHSGPAAYNDNPIRTSSASSHGKLPPNKLSMSWDPTDPNEWNAYRITAWLRYHEFPDSWIDFFRKQHLEGNKFLRLIAYDNFVVYEKYLPNSVNGSFVRFQNLLKQTMTKGVSDAHSKRNHNDKSKFNDSRKTSETFKFGGSKVNSMEDVSKTMSNSSDVSTSTNSDNLFNSRHSIKTHQKTKSTGSLYKRSLVNFKSNTTTSPLDIWDSNSNRMAGGSITLKIPSKSGNHDNQTSSMTSSTTPSSPFNTGFLRRHRKSNSSESSLLNTIFGSSTVTRHPTQESINNNDVTISISNIGVQAEKNLKNTTNESQLNNHDKPSYTSKKQGTDITILRPKSAPKDANPPKEKEKFVSNDDKESLWGKIKRKSQVIGNSNYSSSYSPSTNKNPESSFDPDYKVEYKTRLIPNSTLKEEVASKAIKHDYKLYEYILEEKYCPQKRSDSGVEFDYLLVSKDNVSFIPIKKKDVFGSEVNPKISLPRFLGMNSSNVTLHLTDFGCDVGAALNDSMLDHLSKQALTHESIKIYVNDHLKGDARINPSINISQNKEVTPSKSLSRSSGNYAQLGNDDLSMATSSSDLNSFEDHMAAMGKRYPQTPSYLYEGYVSNLEDQDYWNVKAVHDNHHQSGDQQFTSSPSLQNTNIMERLSSSSDPNHIRPASSFKVIRRNTKNELDFNIGRESPYANTSLEPKREAPRAPIVNSSSRSLVNSNDLSPQKSMRGSSINKTPIAYPVNLMPASNSTAPKVSSPESMVSSYTPGLTHVLVPQPYKGVSEVSRKSRADDEVNKLNSKSQSIRRTNKATSNVSSNSIFYQTGPMLHKANSRRVISSASAADVFEENIITFADAPELTESDYGGHDTDSSDDIIWNKSDSNAVNGHNKSTSYEDSKHSQNSVVSNSPVLEGSSLVRKMTLRPPAEVVYQNLEKFFPRADLDKPVLEGGLSPTSPQYQDKNKVLNLQSSAHIQEKQPSSRSDVAKHEKQSVLDIKTPKRAKTIRTIAREAGEARKHSMKLKRQSTKMWGTRMVEVTEKKLVSINKSKNSKGQYREFAWMKGEMIGKGSFGAVYLSLNITTGEMMAVKQVEVPKYSSQDEGISHTVEALRSEVSTLKDLDHLNIVQYLGFENKDNIYSLFLEYVAGGSVGSLIRMFGRFDEPMIKHLNTQVLQGLSYLHSKGILHRDMKADNLLLDEAGVCKISDFGISRKSKDIYSNSDMTMTGTVFWMAPEMVDTKQGYSAKVDIWSLGCVVLEMYAGKRPWSNLEVVAAMFKIGKSKSAPPIPEDTLPLISEAGRAFLDACFEVNPEKRPTADMLLEHTFSKLSSSFDFRKTQLYAFIKCNDKLMSTKLRTPSQDVDV